MKFNKSKQDNIIKMSNPEAKELIEFLDNLYMKFSDLGASKAYSEFYNGLKNLSNIG